MAHTFDGVNKLIILENGTTSLSIQTLYSEWIDWLATDDNSKYLMAFRTVGGDSISEVVSLGCTYFLINGWRIRPQEANHTLAVEGNLYTDPAGYSPFVSTLGTYNVLITCTVSSVVDTKLDALPNLTADAVMDTSIDGISFKNAMRVAFAVLAAKCSGGGTTTITFRDLSDTRNILVATVDTSGNRTNVVLNLD